MKVVHVDSAELRLKERNSDQIKLALSPFGRWFAEWGLHHKPTNNAECIMWFAENGASAFYAFCTKRLSWLGFFRKLA